MSEEERPEGSDRLVPPPGQPYQYPSSPLTRLFRKSGPRRPSSSRSPGAARLLGPTPLVGVVLAVLAGIAIPILKSISDNSGAKGHGGTSGVLHDTAQTASLNESVRDQRFEFVVSGVTCGKTVEGTETTDGQYCEVALQVTNEDTQPWAFDKSDVLALGSDGVVYRDDNAADLMANLASLDFLRAVNPGDTVVGTVVFDVPATTQLVKLEVHDSPASGGVTITVN